MFRHVVKRFLPLVGVILFCFAHLIFNGWHATVVVKENLPKPRVSAPVPFSMLARPTAKPGLIYDLTFERSQEPSGEPLPRDARLQVQLSSAAKARILIVRPGHPNFDIRVLDVLRGKESLQIVDHREWIDLGPLPEDGDPLEVQIVGLLPGPFGFFEPYVPASPVFSKVTIVRPESPRARVLQTFPRYRLVAPKPIPAGEALARFFFFFSASRVLALTGLTAVVLLFAGWWLLAERRFAYAVCCLVPAVTLIHAVCLPPFQGADAPYHLGTVEALVWKPDLIPYARFPGPLAPVADAIEYDRFADHTEEILPVDSAERRTRLRRLLEPRYEREATSAGPPPSATADLFTSRRAPLYYNAYRAFGWLLRHLGVLDRLNAYVVLSAAGSLLLFLAGVVLLLRAGLSTQAVLLFGLVALVPYVVGVVASCSNYSAAIGAGFFLAACTLVAILSEEARSRVTGVILLLVGSWLGFGIWNDFVFVAVVASAVAATCGLYRLYDRHLARVRPLVFLAAAALMLGLFAFFSGRLWLLLSRFAYKIPKQFSGPGDPTLAALAAVFATPIVVALLLVLFSYRGEALSNTDRRLWARLRTIAVTCLFVLMFIVTPYTTVPFEDTRLDFFDEVGAHWASFWSNNFSWSQDTLFWKHYWGIFGESDVYYPTAVYAIFRWLCVALFLGLPALSLSFVSRRPRAARTLILISGAAVSLCVLSNSLRYLQPSSPWGRYILPLLPLAALPALVRTEAPGREQALSLVLQGAVCLHLWTAITVLGTRYYVGN